MILFLTSRCYDVKGKAIPLQAWTGPQGSRRLRLPHFKTVGTWRLSALRTGRLYLPRKYSWYSFLLDAESTPGPWCGRKDYVNEKFQWHHRESSPRPTGLWHNASTNCATACPDVMICRILKRHSCLATHGLTSYRTRIFTCTAVRSSNITVFLLAFIFTIPKTRSNCKL
jgi:hypothetical protein